LDGQTLSDRGDLEVKRGKLGKAIHLYRLARRKFVRERPPACPDCGGAETYWPHILTGKIMALELQLSVGIDIPMQPTTMGVTAITVH